MRNKFKRTLAVILSIITLLLCAAPVMAAPTIDMGQKGSLTIDYAYSGTKIAGAGVTIYRIAEIDAAQMPQLVYKLTSEFSASGRNVNNINTAADVAALAVALKPFIATNSISGITQTTDVNGAAQFSNLNLGLYLVLQTAQSGNSSNYTPFEPFLIALPYTGSGAIDWKYDATAKPKTGKYELLVEPVNLIDYSPSGDDNGAFPKSIFFYNGTADASLDTEYGASVRALYSYYRFYSVKPDGIDVIEYTPNKDETGYEKGWIEKVPTTYEVIGEYAYIPMGAMASLPSNATQTGTTMIGTHELTLQQSLLVCRPTVSQSTIPVVVDLDIFDPDATLPVVEPRKPLGVLKSDDDGEIELRAAQWLNGEWVEVEAPKLENIALIRSDILVDVMPAEQAKAFIDKSEDHIKAAFGTTDSFRDYLTDNTGNIAYIRLALVDVTNSNLRIDIVKGSVNIIFAYRYGHTKATEFVALHYPETNESFADVANPYDYDVEKPQVFVNSPTGTQGKLTNLDIGFTITVTNFSPFVVAWRNPTPPIPTTKDVTITKQWAGDTNPNQPDHVMVQLYRNSVANGSPVRLDATNNWRYTWSELSLTDTWTVDEVSVPSGYVKTILAQGTVNIVIVNSYTAQPPIVYDTVTVTKLWVGTPQTNQPTSVTVQLYRGGMAFDNPVVLNTANNWTHTWNNLDPAYTWTVDEINVPTGYVKTIVGNGTANVVISNAAVVDIPGSLAVTKQWAGDTNPNQPDHVIVQLYKDGVTYGSPVRLDAANNWHYTWTGLDTNNKWTVDEVNVPTGYKKTIVANGTPHVVIVNTFTKDPTVPPDDETSVTVLKKWVGTPQSEQPKNVTVQLYRDGKKYGEPVILNEANLWTYTWSNLDITYKWTVDEVNIPNGYVKTIVGNGTQNVVITNMPKSDIPQTGDNSNTWLWIGIMLASLGVLAVLIFAKKRKKA